MYVLHAMCVVANTGVLLEIYVKYYNRTVLYCVCVTWYGCRGEQWCNIRYVCQVL